MLRPYYFVKEGVGKLDTTKSSIEKILTIVEQWGTLRTGHILAMFPSKRTMYNISYLLRNKRLYTNVGKEFISTQLPIEPDYQLLNALDVLFDRYAQVKHFGEGYYPITVYGITRDDKFVEIIYVENHDESAIIRELGSCMGSIDMVRIFVIETITQVQRIRPYVNDRVIYALVTRHGGFNYIKYG
ncbi:MAG: DUF5697 family protein [Defluviitaleaceae bacterium]|nr:DUF5697 family protein [Defluviitaleaceae bacterium]